ncbi:hypothetical protein EJ06DRAFT_314363 [Trichodelitschia bisporula]|uniref:Uncharacterized protein n=1 Tax=Trichodelitschia bisporula TaxID=703511 RepID=A0A6G1I3T0_9PEZI|nr:hypothetical protein EJ06DRAFT_314363 [Trichodelitschia bisporula]
MFVEIRVFTWKCGEVLMVGGAAVFWRCRSRSLTATGRRSSYLSLPQTQTSSLTFESGSHSHPTAYPYSQRHLPRYSRRHGHPLSSATCQSATDSRLQTSRAAQRLPQKTSGSPPRLFTTTVAELCSITR